MLFSAPPLKGHSSPFSHTVKMPPPASSQLQCTAPHSSLGDRGDRRGDSCWELIKVSTASRVPVPSLGRTGRRGGHQSVCDRWRGSIKHASPEACTDMKSTGTLAFKMTFPAVFFPGQGPPSLPSIFLNSRCHSGPCQTVPRKGNHPCPFHIQTPSHTNSHSFVHSTMINSVLILCQAVF